jgi:hypothetical protein
MSVAKAIRIETSYDSLVKAARHLDEVIHDPSNKANIVNRWNTFTKPQVERWFDSLARPENVPNLPALKSPRNAFNAFVSRFNDGNGDLTKSAFLYAEFFRLLQNARPDIDAVVKKERNDTSDSPGKADRADLDRLKQIVQKVEELGGLISKGNKNSVQTAISFIDQTLMHITQALMHDMTTARTEWNEIKQLQANGKLKDNINKLTMFKAQVNSVLAHHA